MGSTDRESFEPGLHRMSLQQSNHNVEVGHESEGKGQGQCEYADKQTHIQAGMGV